LPVPIFRWLPQLHIHLNQHLLQCTLGSVRVKMGGNRPKKLPKVTRHCGKWRLIGGINHSQMGALLMFDPH
jgi:hypothetical protein